MRLELQPGAGRDLGAVVILTAGYILWAMQRVYLGAEYKGPHGDHLTPMTPRELAIAAPLLALAILFGVYPASDLPLHDSDGRSASARPGRLDPPSEKTHGSP